MNLLLEIELVPTSCWFSNVRSNVTSVQWDKIRLSVYANANFICEICGCKGNKHAVECHEIWIYDDEKNIQKLEKFQALCPSCHEVKHFGLAKIKGKYHRAFKRFTQINKLSFSLAHSLIESYFKQWEERSQKHWVLDISFLEKYDINVKNLIDKKERNYGHE